MASAHAADREMRDGQTAKPFLGVPISIKDLEATKGVRTTMGSLVFRDTVPQIDSVVAERVRESGAVLLGKTNTPEFGLQGTTENRLGDPCRNPWNLEQGSSGSSAGSAATTAAGLVGFAIGSETLGSIVSPSTRCGVTGLRPTYGRVSRSGAMALSWSMDKLGPLARSVEDCALVFNAVHGADGRDPTARTAPFNWDSERPLSDLRVGYFRRGFESERATDHDRAALETLRSLGGEPVPIDLPSGYPLGALRIILRAEAAAAFDELTLSGRDDLLVRQNAGSWPNSFRVARMIPAVEYIQANRVRTMLMGALEAALEGIDVFITPTRAPDVSLMTNLTGHPAVVVPSGFNGDGTPVSTVFIGQLWADAETLRVAKAWQDATDFHTRRPPMFG